MAERKDLAGWVNCFTEDGTFTDESIGVTYRGKQLSQPVEIYAAAFLDMHRELYRFFVDGDTVIVELAFHTSGLDEARFPETVAESRDAAVLTTLGSGAHFGGTALRFTLRFCSRYREFPTT